MMQRRHVLVLTIGGFASLILAGCGGTATGSRTTIAELGPNNYTMLPPETTTTTVAPPPSVLPGDISPVEQVHTIRSGDSLSKIVDLYDVPGGMDALINWNGWTDGTGHVLHPGQTVNIPPKSKIPGAEAAVEPEPAETDATEASGSEEGCTHTIEAGEFPIKVAKKYGISADVLQQANPQYDFSTTFPVGGQLTIPAGADC